MSVDGRSGSSLWGSPLRGRGAYRDPGTETMHVLRPEKNYPIIGQDAATAR